jgi:hypothetical protein
MAHYPNLASSSVVSSSREATRPQRRSMLQVQGPNRLHRYHTTGSHKMSMAPQEHPCSRDIGKI